MTARLLLLACAALLSACHEPTLTGTWTGTLPVGATDRPVALQLHERGDGRVMGYVVGGTPFRTVASGRRTGSDVALTIEFEDPGLTRTFSIDARLTGNLHLLVGTADDGSGSRPVRFARHDGTLHERRFLFAAPPPAGGDEPRHVTELAVALDDTGGLVAGGFVGRDDCGLFACGGGVTAFDESGGTLTIGFEAAGGGCPMSGTLRAGFDPGTRFYDGSYSLSDCSGSDAGPLLGARQTGSRSGHIASMLDALGRVADDIETGVAFAAPYAPFSPDYEHDGLDLAGKLDELNAEVAGYSDRTVTFSGFRAAASVENPGVLADLVREPGIDFDDTRRGIPAAGGVMTTYRDTATDEGTDDLRYFEERGGDWVLVGNGVAIDFPFRDYDLAPDHLAIHTDGGDVYMALGPWGAHVGPHTGHLEGNAKADWAAQYAWDWAHQTELAGNGDGVCQAGETCGIAAAELLDRNVHYAAPDDDFRITRVLLESLEPAGVYFGGNQHWRVSGRVGDLQFDFVHLRRISPDLRNAMIATGYVDPWSVASPSGNLITGDAVVLAEDDTIAQPQIAAVELTDHPGYYTGKWTTPETPWQQLEMFTSDRTSGRTESFYTWLPPGMQARLQDMLNAAAAPPAVWRYDQAFLSDWLWKAEMKLSNQESIDRDDYSSIHSVLGGWWEQPGGACRLTPLCDQLFSIWPISKDTPFYDASLYQSASVNYLAGWRKHGQPDRFGEVVSPAEPDPVAGTMTIRWRNFGGGFVGFQGIAYRLDPAARTLRIAWGPLAATAAGAVPPAVPANTDACDGESLTCHDHARNPDLGM